MLLRVDEAIKDIESGSFDGVVLRIHLVKNMPPSYVDISNEVAIEKLDEFREDLQVNAELEEFRDPGEKEEKLYLVLGE